MGERMQMSDPFAGIPDSDAQYAGTVLETPAERAARLSGPATPVRFANAREVRRLLVDACGMAADKFEFVHRATLDKGYCPFYLGAVNYCLSVARDRSEWQMMDVTEPAASQTDELETSRSKLTVPVWGRDD